MKLKYLSIVCVAVTAACGDMSQVDDVPTRRDVPTGRDVPMAVDVPVVPMDIPNGVDVPNAMIDVPSVGDVPGVIADTGVCGMGQTACGAGLCANLQSDNNNCGLCGTACGFGRNCAAGVCVCNVGSTMCGATCANLQTDSTNCGACGASCPMNQMCVAGACLVGCPAPNRICGVGAMMTCVNSQTDVNNCGACGRACAGLVANATPACTAGACTIASCNANFANCDANVANGCEVNTSANVTNCGMCGVVCPVRPNTNSASCAAGVCGIGACNMGFGNCDGNAANGCETNVQTDVNNCGACANRCAVGQACVAGACQGGGMGYRPVGPQNNVPLAMLVGWTQCYQDTFANSGTPMATIQAQCNGADIMVACRLTGSATLQLLAQAPRADVFFDTGVGNVLHIANGTGWYYNSSHSFGYTVAGETVSRNSCDTNNSTPASRFCAHTGAGNINGGYRCGANDGLNASAAYERIIYHSTGGTPNFRVTSMSPNMCVNSAGTQAGVNDQRGVLAVTASTVLYTGDAYTVYLPNDTVNVATPVAMNRVHDAMVSDLRTGVGYFFANGANVEPISGTAGNVTQLITLNDQGVEIAPLRAIQLSTPIPMTANGVGFYSGYNRIIVWTGAAWYNVAMPSGVVTQLMGPAPVMPFPCESWAHSGIAEYFGGEPHVVFMSIAPNTGVVRQRIATGAVTVVTMVSPGDVCSLSISPTRNRWYSQYESAPSYIAAGGDEHVVMCPATWDSP